MKTSERIKKMRALVDIKPDKRYYETLNGEQLPGIYELHMSAINDERHLDHARSIVAELYKLLEGSSEGPSLSFERELEIEGLLKVWEAEKSK